MVKHMQHRVDTGENFLSGATLEHQEIKVQEDVDSLPPDICNDHGHAFGEDSGGQKKGEQKNRILKVAFAYHKHRNFLWLGKMAT